MKHLPSLILCTAVLANLIPAQTQLTTVRIASGLAQPLFAGAPPGDEDRVFLVEQSSARIRIVENGALLSTPFLDIRGRIRTGGERGLLGLAFHPDYETNGFFYVNYTRAGNGATVVERFSVSSDRNVADPDSGTVILGPVAQPSSNHNGGCIQFGPDGFLYIAFGDGGSSGDPGCRAQNGGTFLGKILRIDVDGGTPYAIPPTNPFVGNAEFLDEIWSYGLRNPWRFSFDRSNGDMYIGDVGQGAREEVSWQSGTSNGGDNYGWKIMEGTTCFSRSNCAASVPLCNSPSLVLPIHDYVSTGECSVIGGYAYRGCAIPDLDGTYFFADYCSGKIWSLRYDGSTVAQFANRTNELRPNVGAINRPTSFGEDGRGEIIIVDRDGEVFKIVPLGPSPAVDLGFGKVGSNGSSPFFEVCGLLTPGNSAQFILRDAPATAAAALVVSGMSNPTPFPFGTLVPVPPQLILATNTDAQGRVEFGIFGGQGAAVLFGQWLVLDAGLPEAIGVSNALQITFR